MKYLLSRLLHTLLVLWAVGTILFFMFRLMPGTPLAAFIDNTTTAEQQEALIRQFGLDKSLWEQYWLFVGNALQGDLGQSFFFKRPVTEIVMEVLPNTLVLTLSSLLIAYIFGTLAGAYLAWRRGSWVEGLGIPLALTTRRRARVLAGHGAACGLLVPAGLVSGGRGQHLGVRILGGMGAHLLD